MFNVFFAFYATIILYAIVLGVNMAGKKFYDEAKSRLNLSLTKTAVKWLETKQAQLTARSLSDAIERMARERNEVPSLPSNGKDQTLELNVEDEETSTEIVTKGIYQGIQEALSGQTLPLSEMWNGIDAE